MYDRTSGDSKAMVNTPKTSEFWKDNKRKIYWIICTFFYLLAVIKAIAYAIGHDFSLSSLEPAQRRFVVFGGLLLTLLPTLWWWRESWVFEAWIYKQKLLERQFSVEDEEFERNQFENHREFTRAIWASILVVFTTFLINAK